MRKTMTNALLLICGAMLSACGSPSVRLIQPRPMQVEPLPKDLAQTDTPNLVQTLEHSWSVSSSAATKESASTRQ